MERRRPIPAPGPGERDTLVGGVRWRSREAPGRGDPVVYVHGHLASSATWQDTFVTASAGRPAIAVDLPGFGFSDRPWPHDYTAGGASRGLAAFLEARGVGRAVLVGNSLGGATAALLAAASPERVEGLVLVAPATPDGPIPWMAGVLRTRFAGELVLFCAARPFVAWGLRHRLYARGARVTADVIDDSWLPIRISGTRRAALQAIRSDPHAYRGLLDRLSVPTLVVWGERDRLLPVREAERVRARIPGAQLRVIADAGHMPQRERPEAFAAAVREFVEGLSPRSAPPRGR